MVTQDIDPRNFATRAMIADLHHRHEDKIHSNKNEIDMLHSMINSLIRRVEELEAHYHGGPA